MAKPSDTRLAYLSRNVADLSRSVAFYCERLDFAPAGPIYTADSILLDWMGLAGHSVTAQRLRYGSNELELVEVGHHGRPYPTQSHAADLLFQHFAIRCTDIEAVCSRLLSRSCRAALPKAITRTALEPDSAKAVKLPANSGGVSAFKFRDPDGHPLELIEFPEVCGQKNKSHEGIDHSAISVSDKNRSIDFYQSLLGLSVAAKQINHGAEQCRLDGLDAAVVDVVALQSLVESSMHLELLGYRMDETRPSRAIPPLTHAPADIASDRLVFETGATQARDSQTDHCKFIADPDGHFLMLANDAKYGADT